MQTPKTIDSRTKDENPHIVISTFLSCSDDFIFIKYKMIIKIIFKFFKVSLNVFG